MYHQQPADVTHQHHHIIRPGYDSESSLSSLESPDSGNYLKNLVAFAAPSGISSVAIPPHISRGVYMHTDIGQSCTTTTTTMTTGGTTSTGDWLDTGSSASSGGATPQRGLRAPQYARAVSYECVIPTIKTLSKNIHKSLDDFFKTSDNSSIEQRSPKPEEEEEEEIEEDDVINTKTTYRQCSNTIHKSLDDFFNTSSKINMAKQGQCLLDHHQKKHEHHLYNKFCNDYVSEEAMKSSNSYHAIHPKNIINKHPSHLGQSEPLLDHSRISVDIRSTETVN